MRGICEGCKNQIIIMMKLMANVMMMGVLVLTIMQILQTMNIIQTSIGKYVIIVKTSSALIMFLID